MGPKKYTKFQDNKASKTGGNVSIKFEKKIGPDGDELYDTTGQSKFVLKNLRHYTVHPNVVKYYESLKPSKLQRFLTQRKKTNSFMIKVTEYDQNMTLLLMTNNPPPCSVSQQEKDGAPKYFPPDFQFKNETKQTCHLDAQIAFFPKLSLVSPQVQNLSILMSKQYLWDHISGQWFSTDNDFKTEGRYSEVYALRKQRRLYPKLIFAPVCQRGVKKVVSKMSEGETPTSQMLWEPLTFSKLLEEKPTRSVPGDSVFRHGRAQQWIIKNAAVIK